MQYILYNPLAGNGWNDTIREQVEKKMPGEPKVFLDIRSADYRDLKEKLTDEDKIVICGGDGTVNRFVNETEELDLNNKIYLLSAGSGNDFLRDIGYIRPDGPVEITPYLKDLPRALVNGKWYRFLNGIGFGIDGYCCAEGDKQKLKAQKAVNYTWIALKGLLYDYKRCKAQIIVDGEKASFSHVWMVPTMKGRFYGGGMMAAPGQDRKSREVSLMAVHTPSKLYTLLVFPGIFKGKHVKHKRAVTVVKGREIYVKFDRPTSLQIDGETILNVTEYRVTVS